MREKEEHEIIEDAARIYFERRVDPRRGKCSWRDCIKTAYDRKYGSGSWDSLVEQAGEYRRIYEKIKKDKDRLMLGVTPGYVAELDERESNIQQILDQLKKLGLPVRDPGSRRVKD